MYHRALCAFRGSRTMLTLALLVAITACSDSATGTRTQPLKDDRLVVFVSDSDNFPGYGSIFLMHADGTHKSRLTSRNFHDDFPAWSPDGSAIAFTSDRSPAGMWLVNADGSNLRSLLTGPAIAGGSSWSPSGRSIAFGAFLDNDDPFTHIFIADADGSHLRRLTTASRYEFSPSWSPDGTRIVFGAIPDSTGAHIFVIRADGTGERQLTDGSTEQPVWSPDGRRIAFTSSNTDDPQAKTQIFVMQEDGSNQHVLTSDGGFQAAAWSPDGRQLAYAGIPGEQTNYTPIQIFRMNSDGSDVRAITADGSDVLASSNSWAPAWKPAP